MKKGFFCCLLAAFFFGVVPTPMTLLMNSGIPDSSVTAYSPATILLLTAVFCTAQKISFSLPIRKILQLMALGAVGMGLTQTFLALSYQHIPVGTATVLHFLYPTIVTIVSILFFRERGTIRTVLAILCSIVGMVLVSAVGNSLSGGLIGYAFALLSSLTYSVYIIGNDVLFCKEEVSPFLTLFYISLGAFLFQIIRCFLTAGGITLPHFAVQWLYFILYCIPVSAAFLLLNIGISKVGAVSASFATLVEPITSVLVSTIVFHDAITVLTLLGILLILLSVWLNAGKKQAKSK